MFSYTSVIHQFTTRTRLIYTGLELKRVSKESHRSARFDFCLLSHRTLLPDNTHIQVYQSVEDSRCPSSSRFVRAQMLTSGWIIRPLTMTGAPSTVSSSSSANVRERCRVTLVLCFKLPRVSAWILDMLNDKPNQILKHLQKRFKDVASSSNV